MTPDAAATDAAPLALFPLGSVLLPDGLLVLRIFEARYLDLISDCLRTGRGFGVVTLTQGGEVRQPDTPVRFEPQGCLAELIECDSAQPGLLHVRCRGTRRFELAADAVQGPNGLWQAPVRWLAPDEPLVPPEEFTTAIVALQRTIANLKLQQQTPFLEPYRFVEAGWVANRWCELLPLPARLRVGLMALQDPIARLRLVDSFLRRHAIISD